MKRLARLAVLAGALGIGWFLLGARPRDVVLVYDLSGLPHAADLEVRITRQGRAVRDASIRVQRRTQVRHEVKLADGSYELTWRAAAGAADRPLPDGEIAQGRLQLEVEGDQTIVLPLGR